MLSTEVEQETNITEAEGELCAIGGTSQVFGVGAGVECAVGREGGSREREMVAAFESGVWLRLTARRWGWVTQLGCARKRSRL